MVQFIALNLVCEIHDTVERTYVQPDMDSFKTHPNRCTAIQKKGPLTIGVFAFQRNVAGASLIG